MREPSYPQRRLERATQADRELVRVMEAMLHADETITDHGVATRMTLVSASSAICRDVWRKAEVAAWAAEQRGLREMSARWDKTGRQKLSVLVEADRAELDQARSDNVVLRAGIASLIRSIGERGGLGSWRRNFDGFEQAFRILGVEPEVPASSVIPLRPGKRIGKTKGEP